MSADDLLRRKHGDCQENASTTERMIMNRNLLLVNHLVDDSVAEMRDSQDVSNLRTVWGPRFRTGLEGGICKLIPIVDIVVV